MATGKSALKTIQKYHPEVTRVVDGTKPIKVSVTTKDCKNARKKSPGNCAMAKAFKREYDGAVISMSVAYLIDGKKATRYLVPQSVSREIVSFDRHHDFAPGEYSLRAVGDRSKLGVRQYPQPKNKERNVNQVKKRGHRTAGIRSL
jgi:hypothetical protein